MEAHTNENQDTLQTIAWQILTVAPIFRKRLFRPEIQQQGEQIPLSYIQVLASLSEADNMSVTEISSRFDIAKPNITPLIDRMVDAGYVKRVRNSADRRVVHVVVQDKGREKIREIVQSLKESINSWSKNIDGGDMARLSESIEVIRGVLESGETDE